MTKENIDQLGFLEWEKCKTLVEDGFLHKDAAQMRKLFMISQLVEISRRFGVKRATPEYVIEPVFDHGSVGLSIMTRSRL